MLFCVQHCHALQIEAEWSAIVRLGASTWYMVVVEFWHERPTPFWRIQIMYGAAIPLPRGIKPKGLPITGRQIVWKKIGPKWTFIRGGKTLQNTVAYATLTIRICEPWRISLSRPECEQFIQIFLHTRIYLGCNTYILKCVRIHALNKCFECKAQRKKTEYLT